MFFAKPTLLVALFALSKIVVATGTPACLLSAVGDESDPADLKAVCVTNADEVQSKIEDYCGSDAQDALKYYASTCSDGGYKITISTTSSSTATATSTSTRTSTSGSESSTQTGFTTTTATTSTIADSTSNSSASSTSSTTPTPSGSSSSASSDKQVSAAAFAAVVFLGFAATL